MMSVHRLAFYKIPDKKFEDKSKILRLVQNPTASGMVPDSLLLLIRSCSIRAEAPGVEIGTELGKLPVKIRMHFKSQAEARDLSKPNDIDITFDTVVVQFQ